MQYPASTANLQTVATQRKPQQRAYIPREIADSVVARLREHGDGIQRVAKSSGLTIRETLDVLIERTELEKRAAYTRGIATGRLIGTFPIRPIGAQRNAA